MEVLPKQRRRTFEEDTRATGFAVANADPGPKSTRDQRQRRMERAREDLIKGGGRRMKKAREYLMTRGPEHAMSCAIEDGQDLSVLRALIELGAKVWHTSWNVACYTGNFEIMEFLDSNGYWSEINEQAISNAIRAGQLEAAKWLRAHDPPAPWNIDVTNACVCVWAKAAGVSIKSIQDGNPNYESKEVQPGERIEWMGLQPKDLPEPVLQEMADWLVSERAPFATEMMGEIQNLKKHKELEAARNSGDPEKMLESMTEKPPEEINGVKFEPLLRKHGVDAGTILKFLIRYGVEHAMSFAIEQRQDLPVLRALIELGADVYYTSWNMACYNGDFKTIDFLESEGYWPKINTQAISFAIKGGQLKVAKWLRAHDPPAPWDFHTNNAITEVRAKAVGLSVMMDFDEDSGKKTKEYKPGEELGLVKKLPMPLIQEMTDWLVSEGAPSADKMASEMERMNVSLKIQAAMSEGNLDKAVTLMAETGTFPDRMGGVPFGIFLEKGGIEPHTIMGPTALSFGREAISAFSPEQMKAAEQMQRAWKAEERKKFLAISKESGLTPEKIGGVPYDPEALGLKPQPPVEEISLEEAAARGLSAAISMTVSLDFKGASGMPTEYQKNLLLQNGVDITGCHERSDLIEKLKALYELKTEYELEIFTPIEEAMRMMNS